MTAFPTSDVNSPSSRLLHDLSSALKVSGHRLRPFIRLQEDLFLDRFDLDLLVAHLESRNARYLTEEEASSIETIGDLQRVFLPQAA
ncbi:hypothetical protein CEQ90_04655 [Lewinellaceae bacterium SD302]|nr:hypothetical protein CEQ90_04655 [Lewinellaceae bacterium SD302]